MSNISDRLTSALADRYAIERELGSGGMATVYLAHDAKHGRKVAIKVLKPELAATLGVDRFVREIEIAAHLTHPHILPLFDSGEAAGFLYYVMPYVEGESLRGRLSREGRLPVQEAVRITDQIASALSYAHERGVVHRDIKPENILLAGDQAIVADFGIARAVEAAGGERLTGTGLAVGTPAYMSPEQALGSQDVDARSDVYSLGCVVYEMVAGRAPFEGATPQELLAKHAMDTAPSVRAGDPATPVFLERALERALAKDPNDRFASASAFAEALTTGTVLPPLRRGAWRRRAVVGSLVAIVAALVALDFGGVRQRLFGGTGASAETIRLAVLPFENLTGDPAQEYLSDGLTEEMIAQLGRLHPQRLGVIARTSSMHYKKSGKTIDQIGGELGVSYILEGSARLEAGRVRITTQLIRVRDQTQVWADSYEREVAGILTLQSDVARSVAGSLGLTLLPAQRTRLASARPVNRETYEAYLRGKFHLSQFTPEGFEQGLAYLHRAIEQDSTDPLAYAGLALGYSLIGSHSPQPPPDAMPRAKAAALRALELDETLAETHAVLGQIRLYHDWDWAGAEQAFVRSLEINPNLTEARAHYAWYLNLFGRQDEALAEMRRAQQLDPHEPLWTTWLGDLHMATGHWDQAIEAFQNALELFPDFPWAYHASGFAYSGKGMHDEAIAAHERAVAANPGWAWGLAHAYALAGRTDEAREIAARLERGPRPDPFGLTVAYAALGEEDETFKWAEAAHESRHPFTPWLTCASLNPLYDDPRFQALRRRMNLPSSACGAREPT